MYPALPFLQRVCNKDFEIPGSDLVLQKGNQVIIDCLGFHHDPQYFPNPSKFDPDRFTEEEKAKRNKYTYLPFGEGPRNCIGEKEFRFWGKVIGFEIFRIEIWSNANKSGNNDIDKKFQVFSCEWNTDSFGVWQEVFYFESGWRDAPQVGKSLIIVWSLDNKKTVL